MNPTAYGSLLFIVASRVAPEITPVKPIVHIVTHIEPISVQDMSMHIDSDVRPIVLPFPKNPNPQTAAEPPQSIETGNQNEEIAERNIDELEGETADIARTNAESGETSTSPTAANSANGEGGAEVVVGGDGSASLPSHLSNLTLEEREALQQRMTREMAIDEARNSEPRRRIDRNAKQLYSSAIGTSTFLILLVLKIQEVTAQNHLFT